MSSDSFSTEKNFKTASSEPIAACFKSLLSLSHTDLAEAETTAGLVSLRNLIDSLLKQCEPEPLRESGSSSTSATSKRKAAAGSDFDASESADEEPPAEARFWRSKRRSQSEKDEKKARLEKREEILRQLRNRVSEFKSSSTDEFGAESSTQGSTGPEKFEVRYQRASYWPQGSVEWARQILGIELGMTDAEKRQCYLQMVKSCHPDHNQNIPPDAIQHVNAAWELIR